MVFGVLASVGQTYLLASALRECEIGFSGGNGFGMFAQWPLLIVVDIAVFGLVFWLAHRGAVRLVRPTGRRAAIGVGAFAFLAALLAVAVLVWPLLAWWIPRGLSGDSLPRQHPAVVAVVVADLIVPAGLRGAPIVYSSGVADLGRRCATEGARVSGNVRARRADGVRRWTEPAGVVCWWERGSPFCW